MSNGRLAPVIAGCGVALTVVGFTVTAMIDQRLRPGSNVLEDLTILSGLGVFSAVGALLVAKRPANRVGWVMLAVPAAVGVVAAAEAWAGYSMMTRGRIDALGLLGAWVNSWYWYVLLVLVFMYLPLLFPDGKLPSPGWRWLAWLGAVGTTATVVMGALQPTLFGQEVDYQVDNPIGVVGMPSPEQSPLLAVLLAVGIGGAFTAVAVRFKRSTGSERQQLKWFVSAAALAPLIMPVEFFIPFAWITDVLFGLVFIALPVAIGVAVLRYRLYEIDRIISRTLTYALVTALLLSIYAAFTVLPTTVLDLRSDVLVAAATLASAAAFGPARRRIQTAVDRRFNRGRYDARRTVEEFGVRLRDQVDLADLSVALDHVVSTTVQPSCVFVWLASQRRPSASSTGAAG